ncbi:hypothetical protein, partial [Mesorhizobium sp. M4A.F.Ca.ET.050.02.1.1]|uniref:hypothetical protein n=1 Tax=Mesorhizobium sp. M4A.F.Ca.ET.050.02.1.1 TaxID=2496754 RepID=UPI001AECB449
MENHRANAVRHAAEALNVHLVRTQLTGADVLPQAPINPPAALNKRLIAALSEPSHVVRGCGC